MFEKVIPKELHESFITANQAINREIYFLHDNHLESLESTLGAKAEVK